MELGTFLVGVFTGIIANGLFMYSQFRNSIAVYRLRDVVEATRQLKVWHRENRSKSALRDRYRFSLGVILDDLMNPANKQHLVTWHFAFEWNERDATKEKQGWEKDRWAKYLTHVRPVFEDVHTYSFLGVLGAAIPDARRLHQLSELCRKFEIFTGLLDACFDSGDAAVREYVAAKTHTNYAGDRIEPPNNEWIDKLESAAAALDKQWRLWLKLCSEQSWNDTTPDLWSSDPN